MKRKLEISELVFKIISYTFGEKHNTVVAGALPDAADLVDRPEEGRIIQETRVRSLLADQHGAFHGVLEGFPQYFPAEFLWAVLRLSHADYYCLVF